MFRDIIKNKPWCLQGIIKNEPNGNGYERWRQILPEFRAPNSRENSILCLFLLR